MIQLYAKINDITWTEGKDDLAVLYMRELHEKDMLENGLKYALQIDDSGRIIDGNGRYWTLVDAKHSYVPIDLCCLAGLQYHREQNYLTLRKSLLENWTRSKEGPKGFRSLTKILPRPLVIDKTVKDEMVYFQHFGEF